GQLLGPSAEGDGWACAGAGVEDRNGVFHATDLGYLYAEGGCLRVVPAVVIAADHLEAHFLWLQAQNAVPALRRDWVVEALRTAGVCHGMIDAAITAACQPPAPDDVFPRAVCVARATPPRQGSDGHIVYCADLQQRAGKLLADGSIDLRERNSAIAVTAGQQVARLVHGSVGHNGCDVLGVELPTTQGSDPELTAGENVCLAQAQSEGGAAESAGEPSIADVILCGTIDGNLAVAGTTVHVRSVFVVAGDVDYEVGNIDVPGDVEIRGLVAPGFSVRAGGTITVAGTVEPGASLRAGGDLLVAQGILGEKTRIAAGGSVTTKFIQNATVVAGADVTAGSYIFNGRVRAGAGSVRVEYRGGIKGGSIVGGQVMAGLQVEAYRLGSAETDRTLVGIAIEPTLAAEVTHSRQAHQKLTGEIAALQGRLGITSPNDRPQLARLIARTEAAQLDHVEMQLQQLRAWVAEAAVLQNGVDRIQAQILRQLAAGRIRVRRDVYSHVQIQIGTQIRQLTQAIADGCEFFADNGRVRWRSLD
ncbi:MAG: FapA family protein, partial [bacterium]|nr:FapA family protein [bacterium]